MTNYSVLLSKYLPAFLSDKICQRLTNFVILKPKKKKNILEDISEIFSYTINIFDYSGLC